MSSGPSTTNQTATDVNNGISTVMIASESLVTSLITAEIVAWTGPMAPVFAFLVNIFIKPLVSPLVKYIGGKFSVFLQNAGTFTVIDVQVSQEQSALSKAVAALLAAEKSGDQDVIKKAIQAYAVAQSALVNSDGSATATK